MLAMYSASVEKDLTGSQVVMVAVVPTFRTSRSPSCAATETAEPAMATLTVAADGDAAAEPADSARMGSGSLHASSSRVPWAGPDQRASPTASIGTVLPSFTIPSNTWNVHETYLGGMMELRHLRYFVAAVEAGSITRAAAVVRVAQPSLSRQLRQLEDESGSHSSIAAVDAHG